jgi:hypothetical protein
MGVLNEKRCKKIIEAKKFYIYFDFCYEIPEFFNILNRYMDDIDILYIKNKKREKFEIFLKNIPQLEKIVRSIKNINEGLYAFLRDGIEKKSVILLKKIDDLKKIQNRNKRSTF